jgi:two-component system, NtrC family, response regulator
MNGLICIADDDSSVVTSLTLLLKQAGYPTCTAATPREVLSRIESAPVELVLLDMNYSRQTTGEEGLSLLRQLKAARPALPVILMTAWGSITLAVQGVKAGASDFITKPWTNEQLLQSVRTSIGLASLSSDDNPDLPSREELDRRYDFSPIIGTDQKLLKILQVLGRISATDASVLITGESGTGKELLAEAIHRNSLRKERPFIKVNLGGISPTLFESEMFGHVKGAFTDAREDRKGRFEMAHGGTIFLDEVGDLDGSCQVKLLRVLQDRKYEVLGSSVTRSVDTRIIAATNANLRELIDSGEFREDLLYRLNLIAVHVPSLRERRDDIPLLARHFLQSVGDIYRRTGLEIEPAAMQWLQQLQWRGNIRQLRQAIERAVLMTTGKVLGIEAFRAPLTMDPQPAAGGELPDSMTLEEMERRMILRSLERYNGNISRAAEAMGLSRAALYRRIEKFGIEL